jgi:hypothetical protein
MSRFSYCLFFALFATSLVIGFGCGSNTTRSVPNDKLTPAKYFKERQANTITTHGKIMTDSVEEKDGKIQYKTEDGKMWRVSFSKNTDGTYYYGTPQEVK